MSFAQRNQLYGQTSPGRFVLSTDLAGPGFEAVLASRGSAVGDLDEDGDLDLVVSNLDGPPTILINDSERGGRWIRLDLRPLVDAVGARVWLDAGGRRRVAEVRRGSSFLSTEDRRLHFGVPFDEAPLAVRVRWPDGSEEHFDGLTADATVRLTKGEGRR